MDVRDQVLRLVRIQEMILEMRSASGVLEGAPVRLEEIEQRFRERNAEYVAVKQRFEALETDQRERSGQLEVLEEHRKKYMDDLMQVQNQREYAAMLKEIDSVKSQISAHEDAVIKDLEDLENVKTDLASHESHIQSERKVVEDESAAVESDCEAARATLARLKEERERTEAELPRTLVASIHRLESGRQGIFLSQVVDGICRSCYVRVRPQVYQEIRVAAKIHACGNCRRLLYHEPTLKVESSQVGGDQENESPANASEVPAIDGGAV